MPPAAPSELYLCQRFGDLSGRNNEDNYGEMTMTRRDKIEGWTAATILIVGIPALMFASQRMAIGFFS
jgi:hypothetical protein